jgi:dephospho-CoA kinase
MAGRRAATLRIALTGGIASGKSTVAAMLAGHGAAIIDSDAISRELTAAGGAAIGAIRRAFGESMIDRHGALDRAAMRALVFADAGARARLEGILHPMIEARSQELARAAQERAPALVFDIPLLAEGGGRAAGARFDRVLVVDCPAERQHAHARLRASMPPEQLRAVIAAQATRRARLDIADDVLVNAGTLEDLRARVALLWAAWTSRSSGQSV